MNNIYVISLPRTGTKTMCRMLDTLGYKSKHAASAFYDRELKAGFNAFADTPVYTLTFIRKASYYPNNKFIYIEREKNSWADSIESVKLNNGYEFSMNLDQLVQMNVVRLADIESYGQTFGYYKKYNRERFINCYENHKEQVYQMLNNGNLLMYNFDQGWEPICNFLKKDIPNIEIPKLNVGTMFDKS